mgnify:CR=1 FL=1
MVMKKKAASKKKVAKKKWEEEKKIEMEFQEGESQEKRFDGLNPSKPD